MDRTGQQLRRQEGTAMVEFALVLPIMLFIVLGVVDFGRVMNYWNDTNQIAADAARFAAVDRNPGADLATPITDFREWVRLQAETGELREGTLDGAPATCPDGSNPNCSTSVLSPLQVCIDPGDRQVGTPLKVTVVSRYNLIPFLNTKPVYRGSVETRDTFGTIRIQGEATMRIEREYTGADGCTP